MRSFHKIFWIGCGLLATSSAAFGMDTEVSACNPRCQGGEVCYHTPEPPHCGNVAPLIERGLPFDVRQDNGQILHYVPIPAPAPAAPPPH
jgi:hypothetical protein